MFEHLPEVLRRLKTGKDAAEASRWETTSVPSLQALDRILAAMDVAPEDLVRELAGAQGAEPPPAGTEDAGETVVLQLAHTLLQAAEGQAMDDWLHEIELAVKRVRRANAWAQRRGPQDES